MLDKDIEIPLFALMINCDFEIVKKKFHEKWF